MSCPTQLGALRLAVEALASSTPSLNRREAALPERKRARTAQYGRHATRLVRSSSSDGDLAVLTTANDEGRHDAVIEAFERIVEACASSARRDGCSLAVIAARQLGTAMAALDTRAAATLLADVPAHLVGVVTLSCALALVGRASEVDSAGASAMILAVLEVLLLHSLVVQVRRRYLGCR